MFQGCYVVFITEIASESIIESLALMEEKEVGERRAGEVIKSLSLYSCFILGGGGVYFPRETSGAVLLPSLCGSAC